MLMIIFSFPPSASSKEVLYFNLGEVQYFIQPYINGEIIAEEHYCEVLKDRNDYSYSFLKKFENEERAILRDKLVFCSVS